MSVLEPLEAQGFQIEYHSHAEAILSQDFPDAIVDLRAALVALTIPIEEIIAGGGGEAKGTQRLRRKLSNLGWEKTTFVVRKTISEVQREAISHIVDHCRAFSVSDKFGEATTHWRKLEDRVKRGVGNPCPLVLIGLPHTIVTFDETAQALQEIEESEDDTDEDGSEIAT